MRYSSADRDKAMPLHRPKGIDATTVPCYHMQDKAQGLSCPAGYDEPPLSSPKVQAARSFCGS